MPRGKNIIFWVCLFGWVWAFRNNLIYNAVAKREPFFARLLEDLGQIQTVPSYQ